MLRGGGGVLYVALLPFSLTNSVFLDCFFVSLRLVCTHFVFFFFFWCCKGVFRVNRTLYMHKGVSALAEVRILTLAAPRSVLAV